jgi:hypothetical protein
LSREVILAFAPCSTASTCAIESFQRKPNGGDSSSTEYACAAERRRIIALAERTRRIAPPLQLRAHFAWFFIFLCIARIFDRHPGSTLEAGKLRARVNSVKSGSRYCDANRSFLPISDPAPVADKSAAKPAARFSFCFSSDTRVSFSSQENFCS